MPLIFLVYFKGWPAFWTHLCASSQLLSRTQTNNLPWPISSVIRYSCVYSRVLELTGTWHWLEQRLSPDFLDSSVSRKNELTRVQLARPLNQASTLPCLSILQAKTMTKCLKGLGHEIEFKYFDKKWIILGLKKSIYWFLSVEDEPLMSCRLCHFPSC